MTFVRTYWVLVLGSLSIAAGVVAFVTAPIVRPSFGWTAYAPLTSTTFVPSFAPAWSLLELAAGLLVGFALIAGWIGYRLGRARSKSSGA